MRNNQIVKRKLASIAGELLDDRQVKPLVKSVAGSGLKCFGHGGIPSMNVKDKAKMIISANRKAPGYLYSLKEVELAKGVLTFKSN